jgi:hypothetical protein
MAKRGKPLYHIEGRTNRWCREGRKWTKCRKVRLAHNVGTLAALPVHAQGRVCAACLKAASEV